MMFRTTTSPQRFALTLPLTAGQAETLMDLAAAGERPRIVDEAYEPHHTDASTVGVECLTGDPFWILPSGYTWTL